MFVWLVAASLLLASCGSPLAPSVRLGEEFTLAPNATATVDAARLRVRFLRVASDSRCPIDVVCVWAGDAVVDLLLKTGSSSVDVTLHSGDPSQNTAGFAGYTVGLVDVHPYPVSGMTTPADQYRATLRVTR